MSKKALLIIALVGFFVTLITLLPAIYFSLSGIATIDQIKLADFSARESFDFFKLFIGIGLGTYLLNYIREEKSIKSQRLKFNNVIAICSEIRKKLEYIESAITTMDWDTYRHWSKQFQYACEKLDRTLLELTQLPKDELSESLFLVCGLYEEIYRPKFTLLLLSIKNNEGIIPLSEIDPERRELLEEIEKWLHTVI